MLRAINFLRQESGAAALEFAMVVPVLILVMFGIIEFSLIMFTRATMEGATSVSSRLGKTGYSEEGISREQMLTNLLVEKTNGILDPEKIEIITLVYKSFGDIGRPEPLTVDTNGNGEYDAADGDAYQDINGNGAWDPDLGEAGLGKAGDIVVYNVRYPWHVMTPVMSSILGDADGNYPLDVSVVVRNEPYGEKD